MYIIHLRLWNHSALRAQLTFRILGEGFFSIGFLDVFLGIIYYYLLIIDGTYFFIIFLLLTLFGRIYNLISY